MESLLFFHIVHKIQTDENLGAENSIAIPSITGGWGNVCQRNARSVLHGDQNQIIVMVLKHDFNMH